VHNLHDDSLPPSELTVLAKTTFWLMRLAALEELVIANAARIAGWLDDVHETYGYDDYRTLMEYVAAAGKEPGMIEAIVEHTGEGMKKEAMSTLDWIQAQAWEKGLEKGREEGSRAPGRCWCVSSSFASGACRRARGRGFAPRRGRSSSSGRCGWSPPHRSPRCWASPNLGVERSQALGGGLVRA
jgi:hypothetical protein